MATSRKPAAKSAEAKPDPKADETPVAPVEQEPVAPEPEAPVDETAEPEVELLDGDESEGEKSEGDEPESDDESEGEGAPRPESGSAPLDDPNPGTPAVGVELTPPQNPFGQDALAEQMLNHQERRVLVDARTGESPDEESLFELEHEHGRSYICRVRLLENLYLPGHEEPISRLVLAAGMRIDADRAETLRALVRAQNVEPEPDGDEGDDDSE